LGFKKEGFGPGGAVYPCVFTPVHGRGNGFTRDEEAGGAACGPGGELARAGNREKALLALQRAAELDPENVDIQKRITELEREQAAMRNFSKSRTVRAHTNIGQATPADFVSECMKRSDAALSEGDEVRALQELERAKRHDPENLDVNRKIQILRRQIKVNGLVDKALARLGAGEPAEAVTTARRIFEIWPMAPALPSLVARIESWKPETRKPAPRPVAPPKTKPGVRPKAAPEKPAVSPENAAVASIRDRIAKSSYKEAYQEALEAREKYPENATVKDLIDGLEKLLGKAPEEAAGAVAPAPARPGRPGSGLPQRRSRNRFLRSRRKGKPGGGGSPGDSHCSRSSGAGGCHPGVQALRGSTGGGSRGAGSLQGVLQRNRGGESLGEP
jgi:tetratricopeptide (TPR) repeat protein